MCDWLIAGDMLAVSPAGGGCMTASIEELTSHRHWQSEMFNWEM